MTNNNQKYPPPKVIAVDVDGTLFINGFVNKKLVNWCAAQKENGYTLMLWSSRGQEYAIKAAEAAGIKDLFDEIISKPGHIVDDKGWSWIKYTKIIRCLDS